MATLRLVGFDMFEGGTLTTEADGCGGEVMLALGTGEVVDPWELLGQYDGEGFEWGASAWLLVDGCSRECGQAGEDLVRRFVSAGQG